MIWQLILIVSIAAMIEPAWVDKIRAQPRQLFAGQGTVITCTILPHVDNRLLQIGVTDVRDSTQPLDVYSRKTFSLEVRAVPCEGQFAYCSVTRASGKSQTLALPLTILGCD